MRTVVDQKQAQNIMYLMEADSLECLLVQPDFFLQPAESPPADY